ncbi:zinc finger protein 2-like [Pieris brassicae]|uniref:zinc finger protein 2-like n=1 Tax=Pieris brassicae TaxID=7116 RepID=UPI001E65F386|nr:zinc finger protein 2-like [Pieris brassicae]XP_045512529.1 zinc finger protein 2-like [Pieris brassicae]XP_045512530.1 zinc finger protein 2-like [Pieris brassicae]
MESLKCCRICLEVDGFMHNLSSNTLAFYYLTLTGINPLPKLKIPMYVCYECTALLKKYFVFRQKCLRGQAVLQALLSNNGEVTEENLKDIGRESFGLTSSLKIVENVSFNYDPQADLRKTYDLPNIIKEEDIVKLEHDYFCEVQDDSSDPIDVNNSEDNDLIEILEDDLDADHLDEKMEQQSFEQIMLQEPEPNLSVEVDKRITKKDTEDLNNFFTIKYFTKQELMDKMELRRESIKYKSAEYKCELCYSWFLDIRGQEKHAGQHDQIRGEFYCEDCHMYFRTKEQLQTHTKSHPRWFLCKLCPQSYSNLYRAKLHLLYHQGHQYTCEQCKAVFTNRIIYLRHIRNHHPIDFTCCFCGISRTSQIALNAHKARDHEGLQEDDEVMNITAVHCETCDITFTNGKAYNVHLTTTMKHTGKYRYSCDTCDERFSTKKERFMHSLKVHKRRPRRIEKPIIMIKASSDKSQAKPNMPRVKITLPTKRPLNSLQKINWPVKCHYCPDALVYSEQENWLHHRRQHPEKTYMTIRRRFICEHCGKGYKTRHILNYHMNLHNGVTPFKCDVCSKAFYSRTLLRNHFVVVHSDERPFVCDTCGLALKTKGTLHKHNRIHSGEKPFKCDVCDKAFAFKTSRRLHYEGVHLNIKRKKKKKSKRKEREKDEVKEKREIILNTSSKSSSVVK